MSGPRWPSGSIPRWDSRPTTTPGPSVRTIRSSIGSSAPSTEKYTRLFFGVHAIGGKFEVGGFKLPFIGDKVFKGLQTNYYKGSFVGAGISIGYQFYVSPHWNLELSAGAGLARLSYHAEPVSGPKRSSYVDSKRFLPIPTEIGVTFVYLFNSKK